MKLAALKSAPIRSAINDGARRSDVSFSQSMPLCFLKCFNEARHGTESSTSIQKLPVGDTPLCSNDDGCQQMPQFAGALRQGRAGMQEKMVAPDRKYPEQARFH